MGYICASVLIKILSGFFLKREYGENARANAYELGANAKEYSRENLAHELEVARLRVRERLKSDNHYASCLNAHAEDMLEGFDQSDQ